MRAVEIREPGPPDVLVPCGRPVPAPGAGEVLIRVAAAGVNRPDCLQRRGHYAPPPGASDLPGLEVSGVIAACGPAVSSLAVGDRVCALLAGGGYAEQAVVHHGAVMRVPSIFSWEEAGALPEVYLTAFSNLFLLAGARRGGAALVHGGGSGVGTAAIQLLREAGVRCLVTAGSDEKCQRCRDLGADVALNYRAGDFAPAVREATDGRGVDVVLDCIGGKYFAANLECLAVDGRLVIIGLIGGARAEINLAMLLMRRLQVIGSTLRSRPAADKAAIVAAFVERFGAALGAGRLTPVIDHVFPLAQAADAHRLVQSSAHFGKVVLRVE